MNIEKTILQKSVKALVDKAEDCLDAIKTQHANADRQQMLADQQHEMADQQHEMADKQHEIADKQREMADSQIATASKLEKVGNALTNVAIEIKGEMEWIGARTSPPLRLRDEAIPPSTGPSLTRPTQK
jgi:hypothetical protein